MNLTPQDDLPYMYMHHQSALADNRKLLLLQETGKDPITQEPLEADDLVPVKTNKAVKPRPSPATSIPGLLGLFHNVRPAGD